MIPAATRLLPVTWYRWPAAAILVLAAMSGPPVSRGDNPDGDGAGETAFTATGHQLQRISSTQRGRMIDHLMSDNVRFMIPSTEVEVS